MTPKDLTLEHALMIAAVSAFLALVVVKSGPLHVAAWIAVFGALFLASQRLSKVLG